MLIGRKDAAFEQNVTWWLYKHGASSVEPLVRDE